MRHLSRLNFVSSIIVALGVALIVIRSDVESTFWRILLAAGAGACFVIAWWCDREDLRRKIPGYGKKE